MYSSSSFSEFHVAYLFIRMGNSPRPGLWTLEKSSDYGKTWSPWQHFSDSPSDCEIYFGRDSLNPVRRDDDVICTTEFSKIVPLESGEIIVRLLNGRPSSNNYFNSSTLQEWTRATNVRIRLLRTKNLLGHLMSVARQDPTVTRRYFYSIKDISIGGRCVCNGHANTCSLLDPRAQTRLLACSCQHNTCGIQCEQCCPGFEQKKWRQNTNARPFQCEPCNCHGHTDRCIYSEDVDYRGESLDIYGRYEGGGVCQDCRDNTKGINCNQCMDRYYRPYGKHWNETDVCRPCNCDYFYSTGNCEEETGHCECRPEFQAPNCDSCSEGYFGYPNCRPCECNLNGTLGYHCEATDGKCPCKVNFGGNFCKECAPGYFNYPECQFCSCNEIGSIGETCEESSGQCVCKPNFGGEKCDECKDGYYDYPACVYCTCDISGTEKEICDKASGECICKEGYGGPRCDRCLPGYYNYPDCIPCNCSIAGVIQAICDHNGKCPCLQNFAGKRCDQCMTGFYQFPECLACNCDTSGSIGISCNNEGQCNCQNSFDGKTCNYCKENFYNYPLCESCDCNPAGVIAKFAGCGSVPAGELCQCKERVQGRICDQCRPLYWNLNASNPDGCEECDCFTDGTSGALDTCEIKSGQCSCKLNVQGRRCDECTDGTFDLFGSSLYGCKPCDCDIGGAAHSICHKETGECRCHPRITGRDCTRPLQLHYYPTLYQFKFEYEDGSTSTGAQVRYQFDEDVFPEFSKIGYAVFSQLQSEVTNNVDIQKSSFYRLIIRYLNPTSEAIVADILIQSDNPANLDQHGKVLFKSNRKPEFVTMSGIKGDIATPIVLDPGKYSITVKTSQTLFLDYFVLLPAAYYEASILTRNIVNSCRVDVASGLCRLYKYPSINEFHSITNARANGDYEAAEFYRNYEHLGKLNENEMPLITPSQSTLNYLMHVDRPGRYALVVDYITDVQFTDAGFLAVNQQGEGEQDGIILIYPCLYQMVCRGPVMDKESREKVFFIDVNDTNPISINGENVLGVAIKSVTPIPYEQWSTDFIQPQPVCVLKDGACVESSFLTAPDSKKIEFEAEDEERIAVENLPDIINNNTKVIYLDKDTQSFLLSSKVSEPGRYVIVIKYYQPNHPKFHILYRLETERQNYDGKFVLDHCPSSSGCRGVISQDNGYLWFDIDDNFSFTLSNLKDKGVWLDYILLVPIEYYNERLLVEEEFDQTNEFLQECGQDHFNIQLNASDFCKSSVFSLTAEYNVGALPCNCDIDGSRSFECEQFGGQCSCKANIIGRQCEACKTGYYGFPDCKPCDCPSTAICEKQTGECICPARVTGEKCDQCVPYTFGFDQIIGCEECNCNEQGVQFGNLQCDLNNGSCVCASNVVGRSCDKCSYGFFKFPYCEPCRCDLRGTTLEVCDQEDETCFCKKNVQGRECNYCADGTYNLQEKNPEGCTKCFCFGHTTRCENAYLRPFNVSMLSNVSLHTINVKGGKWNNTNWLTDEPIMSNDTTAQVLLGDVDNPDLLDGYTYFGMLEFFSNQNSHLTAYGGFLRYNLLYTTQLFGNALVGPDVILEGKDMKIKHTNYRQPAAGQLFHGAVEMIESNFKTLSGVTVTRDQFMTILRDLKKIYIRASYFDKGMITYLSDVQLTLAEDDPENYHLYKELPAEKCSCPHGYTGLSCEDCAKGFYRDPEGPFGGYCIPCDCNGHADTCDCNTGICQDCQHHTMGDHCEMCIEGYHGNATFGSPYDCMICACPLPVDSNNFAYACDVSPDGYSISCDCKPGYTGHKCQSCANGFYGRPEIEGEYCKPCECSGNIDPSIPGSCDSVNGECIHCLNNTFGAACNLCAPGYYGDAIRLKDCQSCICDNIGTEHCDNFAGTCVCLPNVEGEKCDRCAEDHYGFESGYGCLPCDCGIASNSTQCDDHTGECLCKPGVGGRQCDRCLPGYWNYGPDGCVECSCNTELSRGLGCNPVTGQCECLHQVIGEKCDSCPHRWVFIEDYGCEECDGCHHGLLDVTDALEGKINPVILELDSVAKSFYTTQKLKRLNEETEEIKPEVEKLDPNTNNLSDQMSEIDSLEQDVKQHQKKLNYLKDTAKELNKASDDLLKTVTEDKSDYRMVMIGARNTISEVYALANSLESDDKSQRLEQIVNEAEEYLDRIKAFDPEALFKGTAKEQQCKADSVFADVERFAEPVTTQKNRLNQFIDTVDEFNHKIDNLREKSRESQMNSLLAESLNKKNKEARLPQKLETILNFIKDSQNNLKEGKSYEMESKKLLSELDLSLNDLRKLGTELDYLNENVDEIIPVNQDEYLKLEPLVQEVLSHVLMLGDKKENLSAQYSNITANSNDAIKAVNAYAEIDNNVEIARNRSNEAHEDASAALLLTDGMADRAGKSHQESSELNHEGHTALSNVQLELSPSLDKSLENVQGVKDHLDLIGEKLNAINDSVDAIKVEPLTDTWKAIQDDAINSDLLVQKSKKILEPISNKLNASNTLAQKLPKEVEDTNKDIAQALNQVQRVGDLVPNILGTMDDLEGKQERLDSLNSALGDGLDDLRKKIDQARSLANSIKLGVNFLPNTTLELKPPENVLSQVFNTRISTYFRTNTSNGLLLYLGNEPKPGARLKRDDFMAIEIENGYPVLLIDVGDGPERIISNKLVDDGKWYEAIVERSGKAVTFTIREEDENGNEQLIVKKEELPGDQTNFDIDDNSRLFVGGYSDYQMPDSIKQSSFEGEIEGLKIGDRDVGLWNFVDGQNNNLGAVERDRLVAKEAKHTGYRFGGNGFVVLDARPYNFRQRSHINFRFKTGRDSPNGLLFFVGHDDHYLSLELHEGAVLFQFKMGQSSDVVEIKTPNQFNDDEWHQVEATRDQGNGGLTVDGLNLYQQTFYIADYYEAPDKMYFGGYQDRLLSSKVTSRSFDGCIDDVHIGGTPIDLSRNIQSQDVLPGCPMKFSSVVSFAHDRFGYIKSKNLTVANKLHINLKFKTVQPKGIIFYGMNNDQSATLSLALEDGILVLRSSKFELNTDTKRFNDGQWHVVTAIHNEKHLRLSIDDQYEYMSNEAPPTLSISYGEIYFGGLTKYFTPVRGALPNEAYFVGCIQDVTINTNEVNFASSTDKMNAILNNCPRDILDYSIYDVPYYYPDGSTEQAKDPQTEMIDARFRPDERENVIPDRKEDEDATRYEITTARRPSQVEEGDVVATEAPRFADKAATTSTTTTQRYVEQTTTTEQTTTLRPRPIYTIDQKHPLCELPVIPDYDVDFDSAGYRFGTSPSSYIELESAPKSTRAIFDFSLLFRTNRQNGLLFYASDDRHPDYISLFLKDGYLNYKFSCNGSAIQIVSKNQYENNEWNLVEFSREQSELTLKIQDEKLTDSLVKKCRNLELKRNYFIGGANSKMMEDIDSKLIGNSFFNKNQFFGCMKEVKLNSQLLNPAVPPSEGVLPCSDKVESGVFFGKSGGYVKLREKFRVGSDLTISMDIKPRNLTGVLTSVHGKKSFFIVEMINGDIHFSVDSNDGPRSAIFVPDADRTLCDGNWHTVTVIKSRFVISINVDQFSSEPNVGIPEKHTQLDTTRPLFLGGHPHLAKIRGIKGRRNFQGCIRNFKINDVVENIKPQMTTGNVETGVCPLY
ncbi:CLUMA_CG008952, isoform A [Clunio marinus]|uniref:CLUMA_CG008952, isoform A n=1 Tax=Clunio marinus TaxID=568069 RepID=A0A1J1I5L7_9DIPT|nr:CLUMA_CG008952, isoform A [Clunio marinus]